MLGWLLLMLAVPLFAASPASSPQKVHSYWAPTAFHAEPCVGPENEEATIWWSGGPSPQFSGADGNWVTFPAPSTNADRMCSANVFDIENNKMYMIGGDPAGYYGVPYNQRFDPVTNTWVDMANMPGSRTWLDGEGAYCRHLKKIYIAGGYDGAANNNMWEYDIASNTWAVKATMIEASVAPAGTVMWNDSLLYYLGGAGPGLSGSSTVQVYNVNQNTWSRATSLPEAGDMGSGCLIGDTIYITNAYNRVSGALWTNGRKGVIDPSNPLSITWSTLPATLPTLGFNGGTVELGECIYRLGGFGTLYVGSQHKRGWRYRPSTGEFETLPWLPSPPSTGVARCNFLCGWEVSNELAKVAGDDEGDWNTPNNTYYRNQFTPPHDVGVTKIVVPSSAMIQPGVGMIPKVKVKNMGLNREYSFPVTFRIDSAGTLIYEDGVIVDSILPDQELELTFTNEWVPNPQLWHGYTYYTYTLLSGDMIPRNDTMRGCAIYAAETIYSNRTATPPSLDGYMAPNEWTTAGYYMNFSNAAGQGGKFWGPYTAMAWFMHDDSFLYAAYALPLAASRDVNDQIGFYCDENDDGQWDLTNMEGNFWYVINASLGDEVFYRPITPSGPGSSGAAPGSKSGSGVFNGYLVFETKTPFGSLPYQLNLDPENDTCGIFIYGLDNGRWFGWWPQDLPYDSVYKPYLYGTLILQTAQYGDVGVKQINAPRRVQVGVNFTPKATWKNYGTTQMAFTAFYFIEDPDGIRFYSKSENRVLEGGQEALILFPDTMVEIAGTYTVRCSTAAVGDINPANNYLDGSFECTEGPIVPPGWAEMKSVPGMVKDGAWLAMNQDNGLLYGARGYKSGDFFCYDPNIDSLGRWTSLLAWPLGVEMKPPAKGAAGCYGGGYIWAAKGSNTPGFWRYSIADNTWQQLENIPMGTSGKNPKGGTDMVYVVQEDVGYVYLLKGYKQDFFRFNTSTLAWQQLPDAPAGAKPKWDKGSWLVYDGDNLIYAHKAKYHELWTFNLTTMQWSTAPLQGMPYQSLLTGKTKKSKDGGSAAYYNGYIYALKGGNTCAFYRYSIPLAAWSELAPMPEFGSTSKKKRVKQGGDIAAYGEQIFYAFKGGKTAEFWRYADTVSALLASQPERAGVMGEQVVAERFGFSVAPNPVVKGYGLLNYSVPQPSAARVSVYDVTGRNVLEFGFVASGTGTKSLDLRQLSAGVYLVRFEAMGSSISQKLIVR